ncbi:hypothetical protein MMC07_006891 [Pseudocyphellaria aurata]|nr:hypothetical protein [Pseudocyphellaria aurata]
MDPESDVVEEDSELVEMLRGKVAKLEDELSELQGNKSTLIEPLLQQFSKEDQDKVRAAIHEAKLNKSQRPMTERDIRIVEDEMMKILPDTAMAELLAARRSSILGEVEDQLELAPPEQKRLRRLNYCLRGALLMKSDPTSRRKLWQSYSRCKDHLPPFIHLLPDEAWDILWTSQDEVSEGGQDRALHLSTLARDMTQSGKQLNFRQGTVLIESLLIEGRQLEALKCWQSLAGQVDKDDESLIEYKMLGVRLYASGGDPKKAQELAFEVLGKEQQDMSAVLVPVMEAWVNSTDDYGTKNAWALYLHVKAQLGSKIMPADYDQISVAFLQAGRKDLALAVFKDMMLTGEETEYESNELYKRSLGLISKLHLDSIDPSALTKVSLTALTVLPRKFQNKFFYGSWMKRLIGLGCPDEAAVVIDLMFERGVKPDSKHLNGIMGAWLRNGTAKDKEKAEKMGWAMIQERLDLVRRRRGSSVITGGRTEDSIDIPITPHLKRTVAPATIETFSLLLQHYERRGRLKMVQLLRDHLHLAQIRPNTYFMNHLLYAKLRSGEHQRSWELYKSMSPKVPRDLETFAALWDCEKAHQNRLNVYASDWFPGPRRIIHEMVSWYTTLGPKSRHDVQQAITKELYDQIIRCICLSKDLEGTIVALYAMKEYFHFYPDDGTARMVTLQVASMGKGVSKHPGRRRPRVSDNSQSKANILRISKVFELITEQRADILQKRGVKLDENAMNEENLYLLAEFVRVILRKMTPEALEVEQRIEQASWEMGVGGMRILEPNLAAST